MNKKQIIMMAGIGLVSFGLFFALGLFINTSEASEAEVAAAAESQAVEPVSSSQSIDDLLNVDSVPQDSRQFSQANLQKSLVESQLKDLIFDIRSKTSSYKSRENDLELKEQRVQTALEELYKNIDKMEELRVQLAATAAAIKQDRKALEDTFVRIDEIEKKNIMKSAAVYDKMKAKNASDIIIYKMSNNQLDEAVKIVYYMTERTSANLLGEISKAEPGLAAMISDKLKRIEEVTN